jgi:hypothetical protein
MLPDFCNQATFLDGLPLLLDETSNTAIDLPLLPLLP